MKRRRFVILLLVLSLGGLAMFLVSVSSVSATASPLQITPPGTATPTGIPTPPPTPGTTVTQNIFHILTFPFRTMMEAVVKMSSEILQAFYKEAQKIYGGALDQVLFNEYGIAPNSLGGGAATPLFANIVYPHWSVSFSLALILLPATLALTAVSALRLSATSALGYADLKEALLGWVIAAGAASASFYLLGLAHRLSLAAAKAILAADFGERVSGFALATAFFNAAALTQIALLLPAAAMYVAFFVVFLATTILLALGLAMAAYTALAYLLSVIAPLVIVLGVLPPLRWLHALWLKTLTIAFLLPVIDAFLLKAALSLYRGFFDPGHGGSLFGFIASLLVLGGVLSVLITINFKVGEAVFGALAEIHRQAWDATTGVIQLALSAAALIAGGLIGGAAVGGAGAVLAGGGGGVGGAAGASASAASGTAGASGSTAAMATPAGSASSSSNGLAAGSGGASTNALAANPKLGQRIEELTKHFTGSSEASESQGTESTGQADSSVGPVDTQAEAEDAKRQRPSSSEGPTSASANGAAQSALTAQGDSSAQMRRARLADGFGRILSHGARNPLLRSLGAGLQAGSLLSQPNGFGSQSAQSQSVDDRQREIVLGSARRWATSQELNQEPYVLFDLGRDNSDLMLGGMFRAFMQTERAVDVGELLPVVQGSYGQWLAQGRPGGLPAQREFFDLAMQESNKVSPDQMLGAFSDWSARHAVQLESSLATNIQAAFSTSRPIQGDSTSDLETRIQKMLRTFK